MATDEVKRLTAEEEPSHDEPCRHPARARHGIHETYIDMATGAAQCRACGARTVIPVGPPRLDAAREETIRTKASTRAQYVRRSYLRDVLRELDATRSTLAASREREGRLRAALEEARGAIDNMSADCFASLLLARIDAALKETP